MMRCYQVAVITLLLTTAGVIDNSSSLALARQPSGKIVTLQFTPTTPNADETKLNI